MKIIVTNPACICRHHRADAAHRFFYQKRIQPAKQGTINKPEP
jgi:hypothetical protein